MFEEVAVTLRCFDAPLDRRAAIDRARHRHKVREALRANLVDVVADESVLATTAGQRVRWSLPAALKEYRFRFDPRRQVRVGEAAGTLVPGAPVDRAGPHPGL